MVLECYYVYLIYTYRKVKSKGIPRQAEVALGVPGRLRSRIFSTFGTTMVVCRQPNAPAAFTPGEIPGTHFQRLSLPQGTWFCRKEPWKKSQVTPAGIDLGNVRLNHYATPGPLYISTLRLYLLLPYSMYKFVESSWNVMSHGDKREGKWRGNWRMEWVASTLHTTWERVVSSINNADAQISAASSRLNWRPRRFKWTRPFAERRNLVSARVPSHFNWPLPQVKGAGATETSVALYQITPSHISCDRKLERRIFSETQRKFQFKTKKCVIQNVFWKSVCVVRDGICITFLSLL